MFLAITALAAVTAPACDSKTERLPAELGAWSNAPASGTNVVVGRVVLEQLQPERPAPGASEPRFEGSFTFVVTKPGSYAVALDKAAWIDLSLNGKTIPSTGHVHGPQCTTIRKIVRFDLAPGRYEGVLKRSPAASVKLLIAAAP
jgi:hypothetical protein